RAAQAPLRRRRVRILRPGFLAREVQPNAKLRPTLFVVLTTLGDQWGRSHSNRESNWRRQASRSVGVVSVAGQQSGFRRFFGRRPAHNLQFGGGGERKDWILQLG